MVDSDRRRRRFRSWTLVLRLTAVGIVLFGPILLAAWSVHLADPLPGSYERVVFDQPYPAERTPTAAAVQDYLAVRNPLIDRLLPEGVGGTHFVEDLGGPAGLTFLHTATIAVAAGGLGSEWPGATELHERAHLVFAFVPDLTARLLARLPPPHPDEYAATAATEHLAEMASKAWEIVSPPGPFCTMLSPVESLIEHERRVPGTAGFVMRYLDFVDPLYVPLADQIEALARDLSAGYRSESDALWEAVEARRLPDGTFRPWGHSTVREFIEARRHHARTMGGAHRVEDFLLQPSLIVLSLTGR